MNGRNPALDTVRGHTLATVYLRRLQRVGLQLHQGVSDTRETRWTPKTPAESLAVWRVAWRWTRCSNPRCRCAKNPNDRHGPYLNLRVSTGERRRYQVYVPKAAAAEVFRAVRQSKGVRKRRLQRERMKAQRAAQRAQDARQELRWAIAVLNAAYGRPR